MSKHLLHPNKLPVRRPTVPSPLRIHLLVVFVMCLPMDGIGARKHTSAQQRRVLPIEAMAEKLQIEPDKLEQIKAITLTKERQLADLDKQLRAAYQVLRLLMDKDNPDVGTVVAQLDAIGVLELRQKKTRVKLLLDVRRLLTPKQRALLRQTLNRKPATTRVIQCRLAISGGWGDFEILFTPSGIKGSGASLNKTGRIVSGNIHGRPTRIRMKSSRMTGMISGHDLDFKIDGDAQHMVLRGHLPELGALTVWANETMYRIQGQARFDLKRTADNVYEGKVYTYSYVRPIRFEWQSCPANMPWNQPLVPIILTIHFLEM